MVLVQEYLNENYPQEERGSVTELNFPCKELEGHLDLSDFVNLEKLSCSSNQLTNIDLSKNVNLEGLFCSTNQLTNIDLSKNINLVWIKVYFNKISADLSIFSHLTNLKKLDLGMKESYSNDFYGSLKALENCQNLEWLCIGQNKKITEGLEYVPTKNLTHFGCHGTIFEKALEPYGFGHKGLKKWKATPKDLREQIAKNPILYLSDQNQLLIKENEEIRSVNKNLHAETAELVKAKEEIKTSKKEISNLNSQISSLKAEIATKKEEIKTLATEKQTSNQQLTQIKGEISKLEKTAQENQDTITSLNEKAVKLTGEINAKNKEIQENKKEIEALNISLSNKEKVLKKIHEAEQNKYRNKINTKLEKGNIFTLTPSEQGETLEQAIDNLLEKQGKIENIEAKQEAMRVYLSRIRERSYRGMFGLFTKSKTLDDEIELWKIEMVANEQHLPTRGEKIREFTGFNWLSNKIGSAYSMAIFAAAVPTILTGLGYLIKAFFATKKGTVHGAYQVANGIINQGGNIPPPYQPLPPTNHYLPPQPQPLPEATTNPAPVINNHYHTSPVEKKTRKVQKKKIAT